MCTSATLAFSRTLRRQRSDADRLLWHHLRDRRLAGVTFCRSVWLGPYRADFVSTDAMTAIDVDCLRFDIRDDPLRIAFLERRGFQVLRFGCHDILAHTDAVLERVHDVVTAPRSGRRWNRLLRPA